MVRIFWISSSHWLTAWVRRRLLGRFNAHLPRATVEIFIALLKINWSLIYNDRFDQPDPDLFISSQRSSVRIFLLKLFVKLALFKADNWGVIYCAFQGHVISCLINSSPVYQACAKFTKKELFNTHLLKSRELEWKILWSSSFQTFSTLPVCQHWRCRRCVED